MPDSLRTRNRRIVGRLLERLVRIYNIPDENEQYGELDKLFRLIAEDYQVILTADQAYWKASQPGREKWNLN